METIIHFNDLKKQRKPVYTEYLCKENKVFLINYVKFKTSEFRDFNIEDILECGQCFRFRKIEDKHYQIVAYKRVLNIIQHDSMIEFYPCSREEFEDIWIEYFDLNTNYKDIKEKLKEDKILKEAIEFAEGIRILNQEPFECLISFIISQNNRIEMIKKVIGNICERYGDKVLSDINEDEDEYQDEDIEVNNYLFPDLDKLKDLKQEDFRECKTGFRDKYIVDAINKIKDGDLILDELIELPEEEARKELLKVKGVGNKVADCTLLFSLKKRSVFPTDVWVKRVMEHYYFEGKETSIKKIEKFARDKWGDLAGYAQQYLFYYARSQKIGVKEKGNKKSDKAKDKDKNKNKHEEIVVIKQEEKIIKKSRKRLRKKARKRAVKRNVKNIVNQRKQKKSL